VTFVDWEDLHKWALINRALEFGQPDPTETYSSSPHLYTDLDIPEGAKGRLKSTPAVKAPETQDGARHDSSRPGGQGAQGDGQRSRNRRRTRTGGSDQGAGQAAASTGSTGSADSAAAGDEHKSPAAGTHDGGGSQHRDGNSAPRRRRRRSRGGSPATPAS